MKTYPSGEASTPPAQPPQNGLTPPAALADQETERPQGDGPTLMDRKTAPSLVWRADRMSLDMGRLFQEVHTTLQGARARFLGMLQQELGATLAEVFSGEEARPDPLRGNASDAVPPGLRNNTGRVVSDPPTASVASVPGKAVLPTPAASPGETPGGPTGLREAGSSVKVVSAVPGRMYEGTVRLKVRPAESLQHTLQFVHTLGQMPQLNILRLLSGQGEELNIWINLREPQDLVYMLSHMKSVQKLAEDSNDASQEVEVSVWLDTEDPGP
ncbi:MAG: hypothetical protein HY680_10325 [Chloroflexi bacterium]|nr:hypothetical protein [Chloroflexota bacterium]